jgi:hypothetical protein
MKVVIINNKITKSRYKSNLFSSLDDTRINDFWLDASVTISSPDQAEEIW